MTIRFAPGPTGSARVGDAPGGTSPPSEGRARRPHEERATLERFRELRERSDDRIGAPVAKAILRELKAVGGDLGAVRRALTGRDSGPELSSIVADLSREETLRRVDGAL